MRVYTDTLMGALARHAPDIEFELVELDPKPASGNLLRRVQTLALPYRTWRQRRRAPDAWHVLDGSRAFVAPSLGRTPILVTVHDIIPWLQGEGRFAGEARPGAAARELWRRNGRAYAGASLLVCVSGSTRGDITRAFALPESKSVVVHNPLRAGLQDMASARVPEAREAGKVLHVGNNAFYKNRSGVLRIFARLRSHIGRRLVMAGPAPDAALLALAGSLGLGDRVEWLIDPGDEVLAGHYRSAALMLFPSLYEGFGWPVLEAMAFGLPVVVSDAAALQEVVGDVVAGLPSDDEAGWASAASQLLVSPEAAGERSRRGLARAAQFGTEAFALRMRDAYHQAAGSRSA